MPNTHGARPFESMNVGTAVAQPHHAMTNTAVPGAQLSWEL